MRNTKQCKKSYFVRQNGKKAEQVLNGKTMWLEMEKEGIKPVSNGETLWLETEGEGTEPWSIIHLHPHLTAEPMDSCDEIIFLLFKYNILFC